MLIYTNEIEHSTYLAETIFIIILAFFRTQIPGKDSQELRAAGGKGSVSTPFLLHPSRGEEPYATVSHSCFQSPILLVQLTGHF